MAEEKKYLINEIYYTLHGEGRRYGIPHIFVRFSGCQLSCDFCDTEFESGRAMTGPQIVAEATRLAALPEEPERPEVPGAIKREPVVQRAPCRNVLFCGGEPLLQLDDDLLKLFKDAGWFTVVETNGTMEIPDLIDWSTCSPKVAEHAIKPTFVNELKYVRGHGQGIPRPQCRADHYLLSPIFNGDQGDGDNMTWCIKLVRENPQWSLTVQHHKVSFGEVMR
jgi:7-carboxy-7-deazaguanine synthase